MTDSTKDRPAAPKQERGTISDADASLEASDSTIEERQLVPTAEDEMGALEDGTTGEEGPSVEAQLEQMRGEFNDLSDRHLRLAAEFDNYRRRSQSELLQSGLRAQARLVADLLDVLDDFGRVTSMDPEIATVESVLEGLALVERKLFQVLEEAGLEELDPAGSPFDPNFMEAMARKPAESEEEDDLVDDVFQKGFRFGGHLVRPARVSVRKYE